MESKLPPIVGDFRIEHRIGSGGSGSIYRARQLTFHDRIVALKIVPLATAGQGGIQRQDAEREAQIIGSISHSHIAKAFHCGFFDHDGTSFAYLAMEFIDGLDYMTIGRRCAAQIRHRNDRKRYHRLVVKRIAEIASALASLHRSHIVHLDVKPSNIIGGRADAKSLAALQQPATLVDFGLSCVVPSPMQQTSNGNTPSYASPEQFFGWEIDGRTDIFSLGVTLRDLLALDDGRTENAASSVPPVNGIDDDLRAVVETATSFHVGNRYVTADHFAADLRRWLNDEPVDARRPPLVERVNRWLRHHADLTLKVVAVSAVLMSLWLLQSFLAEQRHLSQGLESALEANDLKTWQVLSARASPWCLELFTEDRGVIELVRRTRTAPPTDPWQVLLMHIDQGDVDGALHHAAAELSCNTLDTLPALREWFSRSVLAEAGADTAQGRRIRLPSAPSLAARVLYEVELSTPDHDELVAPFAELAFAILGAAESTSESRLEALSMLGGAGRASDVHRILEAGDRATEFSEARRLAMVSAARVLRRTVQGTSPRSVDIDRCVEIIGRWNGSLSPRSDFSRKEFGTRGAWIDLVNGLSILARRVGAEPNLILVDDVDATTGELSSKCVEDVALLLSVAGRDKARDWLARIARDQLTEVACGSLGWGLGALDRQDVTTFIEGIVHERIPDGDSRRTIVATAREQGRCFLLGREPSVRPDEETLLGKEHEHGAIVTVENPQAEGSFRDPKGVRASWSFLQRPISLEGGAARAIFDASEHVREGSADFLKLARFGRSSVEFVFNGDYSKRESRTTLVLQHQIGLRSHLPDQGRVRLRLLLNDAELCESWVTCNDSHEMHLDLPLESLAKSPHNRIRLHLASGTTTTYRLHAVQIVQAK